MNRVVVAADSLTAVADKIREKGNTSEGLEFPNGFIEAIDGLGSAVPSKPYIDSSKIKNMNSFFAKSGSNPFNPLSLVENFDTSNVVNFSLAFWNRTDLLEIDLDMSSGVQCNQVFLSCTYLKRCGDMNCPNAENLSGCFMYGSQLQTVGIVNSPNCINFQNMFLNCSQLHTVGSIDLSSATIYGSMFSGCQRLVDVRFEGIVPVFNDTFTMAHSPLLSLETLASLVNALHNTDGEMHSISLGAANIAKLTDEQLEIIASKNINLQ